MKITDHYINTHLDDKEISYRFLLTGTGKLHHYDVIVQVFMKVCHMPAGLTEYSDTEDVSSNGDFKIRARYFPEYDVTQALKIWCFLQTVYWTKLHPRTLCSTLIK